jgi:hypothetical protein
LNPLNRSEEALIVLGEFRWSLLTSAATRFMGRKAADAFSFADALLATAARRKFPKRARLEPDAQKLRCAYTQR